MAAVERLSITLPSEMAAILRKTVEAGQYASTSEVIRDAVRQWTRTRDHELQDLEAVREAVRLGDDSGASIPADEVFAEVRRMIAERRASGK